MLNEKYGTFCQLKLTLFKLLQCNDAMQIVRRLYYLSGDYHKIDNNNEINNVARTITQINHCSGHNISFGFVQLPEQTQN